MLLGCDYLDPVRGVGPKKALKLIQDHRTLERILEHLKQADDAKKAKASDAHGSDDDRLRPSRNGLVASKFQISGRFKRRANYSSHLKCRMGIQYRFV